jgi:hypothetical protein
MMLCIGQKFYLEDKEDEADILASLTVSKEHVVGDPEKPDERSHYKQILDEEQTFIGDLGAAIPAQHHQDQHKVKA